MKLPHSFSPLIAGVVAMLVVSFVYVETQPELQYPATAGSYSE